MRRTLRMDDRFGLRSIEIAAREHANLSRRSLLAGTLGAGSLALLQGTFGNVVDALAQPDGPLAIRKQAHSLNVDDPEVVLLRDAVQILRDRGDAPGGWLNLSFYHRDFCGVSGAKEIHFSWFFLPWHRAFLTIVERHLQEAVNEPALALPYWDWYSNRTIPGIYLGQDNPLLDSTRSPNGTEMSDDDFGFAPSESDLIGPDQFAGFGGSGGPFSGSGSLESGPHNGGHIFVGGNMGAFSTAAFDPLFFAHHGNIDRLWEVWRSADPEGARHDPEPGSGWDARDHAFLVPDGTMLSWKSSELIKTSDLGYEYDNVEPKELLIASSDDDALAISFQAVIPMASEGGRSSDYELTGGGLLLKPQIPESETGLASTLASSPANQLVASRSVFLDLKGFKLPRKAGYLHVHVNFDNDVATIDRAASLKTESYAASYPIVSLSPDQSESQTIDISVNITNRVRQLAVRLTEMTVLVVPFNRSGERLDEGTVIESISLTIR